MGKTQVSDIIILAIISGITAFLTSIMGISGTVIGAVVSSFAAEILKTYFKEPVKNKISEHQQSSIETNYYDSSSGYNDYNIQDDYNYTNVNTQQDTSHISTKTLFLFPLVVILIIELVHFLGAINIIPNTLVYNLESMTNWTLFRTIGYALIIMGLYPIFSKKLSTHHGIILIVVGIIELIIGYADTNSQALALFSIFSSLQEYVNILIILAILYTVITIPDEIKQESEKQHRFNNKREFNKIQEHKEYKKRYNNSYSNRKFNHEKKFKSRKNNYKKNRNYDEDEDSDYFYYYEE